MMNIPNLPGNPADYGILFAYVVTVLIFVVFLFLLNKSQQKERDSERADRKVERESFVESIKENSTAVTGALKENTKALQAFKDQVARCPYNDIHRTDT